MAISDSNLAYSILLQATNGRPIVVSAGLSDTWLVQCNGHHFIQDETDKNEAASVKEALNKLVDEKYLRAEEWNGADRYIYITDKGLALIRAFQSRQKKN